MAATDWQESFFATTRGQIFARLRGGPKTVTELAAAVGLTDNGVRVHLQALVGDGLVRLAGTRRSEGAGQPARLYEVAPGAQEQFSRAYAPLLRALVETLADREGKEGLAQVLREAGRKLGRELARPAEGPRQQALAAAEILTQLGGAVELEEHGGSYRLRGCGCPVSAATAGQPTVCRAVEALLAEATGAEIRECCVQNGQPQCQFEVGRRTARSRSRPR